MIRISLLFQNISCYCLSWRIPVGQTGQKHFKTSHVIVYRFQESFCYHSAAFQNISCYCLSALIMEYIWNYVNFKTSHVIVYLHNTLNLLRIIRISKHLMLLFIRFLLQRRILLDSFQNISCYCLSPMIMLVDEDGINFKTSHVIVYRKRPL